LALTKRHMGSGNEIVFTLDMGQISSNLPKKALQQDSMPFSPLKSRFTTFLLQHVQKSKFGK